MGLESCHPAVSCLFFAAVLYGSATFSHPVFLLIGVLVAFAYSVKRGGKKALLWNLVLLLLAAVIGVFYAAFHHFGATVLARNFIGNRLTLESLIYGFVVGGRCVAVCMWLSSLLRVITADQIVYLFGRCTPHLALFLTILLRFLPRVRVQARRIVRSRRGIGRAPDQGNVFQRVQGCVCVFSALINWMIDALATQADSMRSRGGLLRGRSAFSIYRFDERDRALVVALSGGIILTAMGVYLSATELVYAPVIVRKPLTGLSAVTAGGYAFLCLLPLAFELWNEFRYRYARKGVRQNA